MQNQQLLRPFELAKEIESVALHYLVMLHKKARLEKAPEDHIQIERGFLYNFIISELSNRGSITAGFFNRIIDDMKKAGIIGTAKGGSILYLTEISRKTWVENSNETAPQTEVIQ